MDRKRSFSLHSKSCMEQPTEAWADASPPRAKYGSSASLQPGAAKAVLPVGPPPSLDLDAESPSPTADFAGVVPGQSAAPLPKLEECRCGGPTPSAHLLLEQEPAVLRCMRFMKAEAFMELTSPACDPGDEAFGVPESLDVLVCVCQVRPSLSEGELGELKCSVDDVLRRLRPGHRCFVFCDGLCRREDVDPNEDAYSRLRLKVFLYADLVVYLSEERRPCRGSDSWEFSEDVKEEPGTGSERGTGSTRATTEAEETVFGPMASIPAEECGRVCLERFVGMAKAAMVGDDTRMEQVVLSKSPTLRKCMSRGAKVLSDASLGITCGKGNGEASLHSALDFYRSQIEASMLASQAGGRDLAASFIEHLDENWAQEAQVQQRRFDRFVDACMRYALHWLALSPSRVQSIKTGSRPDNPWPVLIVGALPVVVAMLVYALPYNRPDAGYPADGFLQNPFFVFYCWPLTQFPCWYLFPEWARMSAFPELSIPLACAWTAAVTALVSLGIGAFSVSTGIFPVPFLTVLNITGVMPFLPLIWYCLPREVRARPDNRRRVLWSSIGLALLIGIFGMFFPLFNSIFQRLEGIYQNIAVLVFLSARVMFEKINKMLARKLNPDMFPLSVALAVYAYEFSMCVMMSCIKHPLVLAILIGADVCENAFHLWCLWKKRYERDSEGSRLCIVSVMLLREFVELVVPMQLIVIVSSFQFGPSKQFNGLVSAIPEGMPTELQRMLAYLAVDFLVEATIFTLACYLLRAQGLKPLHLLRGVIDANLGSYFAIALACVMFYLQLQHSHFGCDFSFRFLWVSQQERVSWSQGTAWWA